MIVQIYEIQDPREAEICIELGVDHLGSVLLSEGQWRIPLLREVRTACAEAGVKHVLLPLFRSREVLYRALEYYRPDYIHLCENLVDENRGRPSLFDEAVQYQGDLKERFPDMGIIRTIPVPRTGVAPSFSPVDLAKSLAPLTDLSLIDTWTESEPVQGYIGITGQEADREIAKALVEKSQIPVLLAGGLSPKNVYEAVLEVVPAGVDSCSWTNAEDKSGRPIRFKKDLQKVKGFVEEVRRAEKALRSERNKLEMRLHRLKEKLQERERALPAHSVRPHQIMAIEALEDDIASTAAKLHRLRTL